MAGQVIQRLEVGLVQTITITIASTGVAQQIGPSISSSTVMKKCQAVNFRSASATGVFIGWSNQVSSTQYRRKQTASLENWELSASEECLKNLWISGTAGETLILELIA